MSSGIEILVLAPLLLPALTGSGATLASGATAAGSVTVAGGSVVTTGAFTAGSAAGAASTPALAGAATIAGSVVLVAGAAGAALLAAQHLQSSYNTALNLYQQRIENEQAGIEAAGKAMNAAASLARKAQFQAKESAEVAFLRTGIQRLQKRIGDSPDVDPRLPGGCAKLLAELSRQSPNLPVLYAAYESLNELATAQAAKRREGLRNALNANSSAATLKSLQAEVKAEIKALRIDMTSATPAILSNQTYEELEQALKTAEGLVATQPRMAEQSLQVLRGRLGREISLALEHKTKQREAQEKYSARLRELAGRISGRAQAVLTVLENEELAMNPLARSSISALQIRAMDQLQCLAAFLSGESSTNLTFIEQLAQDADALFDTTKEELQQIARRIYLQEQVAAAFMELGYQVTTIGDSSTDNTRVLASLGGGRGVEVRLDGADTLSSEMVALTPSATDVEPHSQEKVCELMDEVFESLRARGCGVREKKRRHYTKGQHKLRVVEMPGKKKRAAIPAATPIARRQNT